MTSWQYQEVRRFSGAFCMVMMKTLPRRSRERLLNVGRDMLFLLDFLVSIIVGDSMDCRNKEVNYSKCRSGNKNDKLTPLKLMPIAERDRQLNADPRGVSHLIVESSAMLVLS